MKPYKKELAIGFLLTIIFSGAGFLFINFFYLIYISNKNQSTGFPRTLLNYIPRPINSWNYPDLNKSSKNKFILIGDSHGEGAGDAFLNGIYEYSAGHFIAKASNITILLASNSGSTIPLQLYFIQEAIKGKYGSNKIYKHFKQNKDAKNIISFFYEGNDLEEQYLYYDNYIRKSKKKISKFKRVLNKYFPLIYLTRATIIRSKLFNQTSLNIDQVNPAFNKICRDKQCRFLPPMQSAAPELTKKQIDKSISQTSEIIINFKNKYKSNICLVYIPSPATLYSPKIIKSQKYLKSKHGIISSLSNNKRSKYIRNEISQNISNTGIRFLDSTNYLKIIADKDFIHGEDSNHFNQLGYKSLGTFVSSNLSNCFDEFNKGKYTY